MADGSPWRILVQAHPVPTWERLAVWLALASCMGWRFAVPVAKSMFGM